MTKPPTFRDGPDLLERSLSAVAILCAGGALWAAFNNGWWNFAARTQGEGKPIASVVSASRDVRSRPASVPGWSDVGQGHVLYGLDHVYTGAVSSAELKFEDATTLAMAESSLVVLDFDHKLPAFDVRRGVVRIASDKGGKDVAFRVHGVSGLVKGGGSEAVVSVGADGVAEVTNVKGDTVLNNGTGNAVAIGAQERSRVTTDGAVGASERVPFTLGTPAWDARLFREDGDVTFTWTEDDGITDQVVEVSADPAFSRPTRATIVAGGRAAFAPPTTGTFYWRVVGKRTGAAAAVASELRPVQVTSALPPRLLRPAEAEVLTPTQAEGSTGPRVKVDWIAAESADRVAIEVLRDDDTKAVVWTGEARRPPLLGDRLPPGSYVARARAGYGASRWSAWTEDHKFKVKGPAAPPEAPQLVAPADGETLDLATAAAVSLIAGAGVDARRVHFETSTQPDFAAATSVTAVGTRTSFAPPTPGTWYWRTRVEDGSGRLSEASSARRLLATVGAPALLEPEDGAKVAVPESGAATATFHWAPMTRLTRYDVEVSRDPEFTQPITAASTGDDAAPWQTTEPGTWYWRVTGKSADGGLVARSAVRKLDVVEAPLLPPPSLTPARRVLLEWGDEEGAVRWNWSFENVAYAAGKPAAPPARAHLTWPAVDGAAAYDVEVSSDQSFATRLVTERVTRPEFLWIGARPGQYWYRVRSVAQGGRAGAFSEPAQIDVAYPAPALASPAAATRVYLDEGDTATVTFKWSELPHAAGYLIEVSETPDFGKAKGQPAPTGTAEVKLKGAGKRWWRVRGILDDGTETMTSAARDFIVQRPLEAPTLTSPARSTVVAAEAGEASVTFVWELPTGAVACDCEIAADAAFKTSATTRRVALGRFEAKLPRGPWFWHVQCRDKDGAAGLWSETRGLVVGPAPPATTAPLVTTAPRPDPSVANYVRSVLSLVWLHHEFTSSTSARAVEGTARSAAGIRAQWWPGQRLHTALWGRRVDVGDIGPAGELGTVWGAVGARLHATQRWTIAPYGAAVLQQNLTYAANDEGPQPLRRTAYGPGVGATSFWTDGLYQAETTVSIAALGGDAGWVLERRTKTLELSSYFGRRILPALSLGAIYALDLRSYDGHFAKDAPGEEERIELRVADQHAGGLVAWHF